MSKIRILRILNRFNLGGPTYNASYLTKYLSDDFETLLIGGKNGKYEASSLEIPHSLDIEPLILPELKREISPYYDLLAYKKIKKIIKDFNPQIVHTHASKAGAIGRWAAYHSNVPVIVHTFHGHVFDSYFNNQKTNFYVSLEKELAKKTDLVIALSNNQKKDLCDEYKILPDNKVKVIPLGFELNKFTKDKENKRDKIRLEFNISNDTFVFSLVGRIVPIKNHKLVIDALSVIKNKTNKRIKILFVGDGELRTELMEYANINNLKYSYKTVNGDEDIIFTGWRNDIDYIMAASDAILLTSNNEGTPVSLIEAQACKLPIISTNVGGVIDIVKDNAILINKNDANALSNAMLKLVNGQFIDDNILENRQDFIIKNYSIDNLVSNIKDTYIELLENKVRSKNK
ncbi:MAG: glycosyltransferase [Bacteroidales bacterium]|nr:glycosyltransferase [Bacteroidales bacterium]